MDIREKVGKRVKELRNKVGISQEELADMVEIIDALAALEGKTLDDVIEVQKQKRLKRGGFQKKIYLEKVEE